MYGCLLPAPFIYFCNHDVKYLLGKFTKYLGELQGGAYKDWPEDRPETIFLQKWTGDTFLVIFRTGQKIFWFFRFLFIFKSILELKLIL